MALTKLVANVNNIQALSDRPNTADGLTSSELKERFDRAGATIKNYLNETLTEQLDDEIVSIGDSLSLINTQISNIQSAMLSFDQIYPVGSIYISVNSTTPGSLFGGTWERIQDRFLLASGTTYANGTTGGSATHTLTIGEMPSHGHNLQFHSAQGSSNPGKGVPFMGNGDVFVGGDPRGIQNTGGGQPHSIMPPYLAVYVWKRVS